VGARDRIDRRESHGFISSWVAQAWWDRAALTCEVEFHDGVHWVYSDVDKPTWDDFTSSKSPGLFVRQVLSQFPGERR
jgi:hypothetical protein